MRGAPVWTQYIAILTVGWRHVFAAETDTDRAALLRACGACEHVYSDATAAEATTEAPQVDVWTATFECGPTSGMDRAGESATAAPRADNLRALDAALGYVRHHLARGTPPRVLMLENSANIERLHSDTTAAELDAMLLGLGAYAWEKGILCPTRHANTPNARARVYWLATLRASAQADLGGGSSEGDMFD